jgi:hypothetical protein
MCAEARTILRAVAADFFSNCWCLEIPGRGYIYIYIYIYIYTGVQVKGKTFCFSRFEGSQAVPARSPGKSTCRKGKSSRK